MLLKLPEKLLIFDNFVFRKISIGMKVGLKVFMISIFNIINIFYLLLKIKMGVLDLLQYGDAKNETLRDLQHKFSPNKSRTKMSFFC